MYVNDVDEMIENFSAHIYVAEQLFRDDLANFEENKSDYYVEKLEVTLRLFQDALKTLGTLLEKRKEIRTRL